MIINQSIQAVISEWVNSKGIYSYETRIHPLINPTGITSQTPYIYMAFIIDVNGFFYDSKRTEPIRLHYERVISIDRFNPEPAKYADSLRGDLNLLTQTAYSQFEEYLSSIKDTIYTSDPLYMKTQDSDTTKKVSGCDPE